MSRVLSTKTARNNAHVSNACVGCRERKTKCDGAKPVCSSCNKRGRDCTWLVDSDRRTARGRKCEECVTWRAGYAELEARLSEKDVRLAQTQERLAQTQARLAQILSETNLSSRELQISQDALAMSHHGVEPSPTALQVAAERHISLEEPLFPLHEAGAALQTLPEAFVHEHCIDTVYWIPASASPTLVDGTGDLEAFYACPFAAAGPSCASDEYADLETLAGDTKQ